eukprot:1449658-Prymnesium_polylepis.1
MLPLLACAATAHARCLSGRCTPPSHFPPLGRSRIVCSDVDAPPTHSPTRGLELLDSYERTTQTLLDEIADTERGDRIFFQLYLLEGGESSERVLAALEEAGATRGVRVAFGLDVSYVSMLSRLTEKTTTLIPRVEQLATRQPGWCECTYGSKPDHSKYALFMRSDGRSSAILGGMNIGDRFR